MSDVKCPICEMESRNIFQGTILSKYKADYYQCPECGFVFIDSPHWIEEAYNSPITIFDTGIINRNVTMSQNVTMLLRAFYDKKKVKCLDFGGGYGVFARLMRDQGYPFFWYDKFSDCLLARGFESDIQQKYECLTAFEVFEHLTEPKTDIKTMLEIADTVIFSTQLYDKGLKYPKLGEWWYYLPEAGQHVSFYSQLTLETIAAKYHVNYYIINNDLHVLSKHDFSSKIKRCRFMINTQMGHLYRSILWELGRSKGYSDVDMDELLKEGRMINK